MSLHAYLSATIGSLHVRGWDALVFRHQECWGLQHASSKCCNSENQPQVQILQPMGSQKTSLQQTRKQHPQQEFCECCSMKASEPQCLRIQIPHASKVSSSNPRALGVQASNSQTLITIPTINPPHPLCLGFGHLGKVLSPGSASPPAVSMAPASPAWQMHVLYPWFEDSKNPPKRGN